MMEESGKIDLACCIDKFCVSSVVINTATVGMERFVSSWNFHTVSGDNYASIIFYYTL